MGYEDPSKTEGSEEYVLGEFRRIRDSIKDDFRTLYLNTIRAEINGKANKGN
jgi:hypothetical protein